MAAAVVLSVRGGLFDRLGSALTPAANALATLIGYALGELARPFFWLVDRLGIDPTAFRNFLARLRNGGLGKRLEQQAARPDAALWQRLLGLAVFVLIAVVVYRLIRRVRPFVGAPEPPGPVVATSETALPEEPPPDRASWFRRELPADAVRRRYAETLLALRRRRIEKDPATTPSEFLAQVGRAYPTVREGFTALTRAYEDVRYGNLRLGEAELRALARDTDRILQTLRRDEPLRETLDER
jgi:hypothetical protein